MTRPELPWHKFTKVTNFGKENAIHLFRRITPPAEDAQVQAK
jgi:hypothetical protein